jgi:hypothetical protein
MRPIAVTNPSGIQPFDMYLPGFDEGEKGSPFMNMVRLPAKFRVARPKSWMHKGMHERCGSGGSGTDR